MSLSNKQMSSILRTIADATNRMIDVVDNNKSLSMSDAHTIRNSMLKSICNIELDDFMVQKRKNHRLLIKRGTRIKNDTYVGKNGEITVDTDEKTLRVHDGQTAGGTTLARVSDIPEITSADYVIAWQNPTAENNYTWYRKYKSGWLEMGGSLSGRSTTFPAEFASIPTLVFGAYTAGTTNTPQNAYNEITTTGFTGWRTRTNAGWDSGAEDWNGYWAAYGIAA